MTRGRGASGAEVSINHIFELHNMNRCTQSTIPLKYFSFLQLSPDVPVSIK